MLTVNIVCYWTGINCGQLADYVDLFEEKRRRTHTALADAEAPAWRREMGQTA